MSDQGGEAGSAKPAASVRTTAAAAAPGRAHWARAAIDRVPAKWIGTAATALFLASTAAFGGLADVPKPPLAEIGTGETFIGAELEMTPVRATLATESRGSGVFPKDGERVLTLVMDATSVSDVARSASAVGSLAEIRLEGHPDVEPRIVRVDDPNLVVPWLQPGVPTQVALSWLIPEADAANLSKARFALHTATEYVGSTVMHGRYWDDVTVAAYATLPVEKLASSEETG